MALQGVLTINSTEVTNNTSGLTGGGIEILRKDGTSLVPSVLLLRQSTLRGNSASEHGGGINVVAFDALMIIGSSISLNTGAKA